MKPAALICLLLASPIFHAHAVVPKVIYGEENRSEPYEKPEYQAVSVG